MEKRFLVQSLYRGNWLSGLPETEEHLMDAKEVKEALRMTRLLEDEYSDTPGKGQYRFAEFESKDGELVAVAYYNEESFSKFVTGTK